MAVNFTSNIALAKPTESEIAKKWTTVDKLNEDNNLIIQDKTDVNFSTYTPGIIAQTTAPSVGAGAATGRWQEYQGFVWGTFIIVFNDPGVTAGSGEFGFGLPALADNTYHQASTALNTGVGSFSCVGEGYIQDNSNVNNCGTIALELCLIGGASYVRLVTEAFGTKTSRLVRDAMPFTLAHADSFTGMFFYKKA